MRIFPLLLLAACTTMAPDTRKGTLDSAAEDTATEDTAIEEEPCALEGGALPIAAEGALLLQDGGVTATRERCFQALHAGVGAAGSTLTLELSVWEAQGAAQVAAFDLLGQPIADWVELAPGEALSFELSQSGEFLVRLSPVLPDGPTNDYALALTCEAGCELEYTRYPFVFLHGAGTTDSFLEIVDTWGGLGEHLGPYGYHLEIHPVAAMDSVADRAAQWLILLDQLEVAGVGRRFNLLGHSQGGLDARYLTSVLDEHERIASLTTISTPHHGASTADLICGLIELGPLDGALLDAVAESFYGVFGQEGEDLTEQLQDLTTASAAVFNEEVLDVDGVYYRSWAGHTCALLDLDCQDRMGGEIVTPVLSGTFAYLTLMEGDNDGQVGVVSAQWGDYQGELGTDHYGAVGVPDLFEAEYDHLEFFLDELRHLAALGY